MSDRTKEPSKMFQAGTRLRECRELRGWSRQDLANMAYNASPSESGRLPISVKQIGYIENGTRELSAKYALLLSSILSVRKEYLLLIDDYKTESERISKHVESTHEISSLIIELMELHFFRVSEASEVKADIVKDESGNILKDENGKPCVRKYNEVRISLTSPRGSVRYLSVNEFSEIIHSIDDFIDYQCSKQFKALIDGVRNIYDWRV